MATLGVVAHPSFAPPLLLDVAHAAERAGIEEVWLWEDCFTHAAAGAAGAILGATEQVRVGIGVLPVPLRNAALEAMELATLAGMFPGRLVPGVGHGVQPWMAQAGAKAASPLTLLREHLVAVRALLDGETVTSQGRYVNLDGVALAWPPATRVPLLSAAEGPRTLELVGELADGVILVGSTTLEKMREALATVEEARSAAGRAAEPFAVVSILRIPADAMSDDPHRAADTLRARAEAGATTLMCILPEGADPVTATTWLGEQVRPLL